MAPFFIIGTERSGSNLIRLILNANSNVVIPHPPHIYKYFINLLDMYGDLNVDSNFRRLIHDVVKMVQLHAYKWEISFDENQMLKTIRTRDLIGIKTYIYQHYADQMHKKHWGCKSTFMLQYVEDVLKHCPMAKFLYLVRDGRDVAQSAKKSIFNNFHTYYIAERWRREQLLGISWLKKLSPKQICLIKYEELLSKPDVIVSRICAFLEIPFESNMLNYYLTSEAKKSASLSESWENTSKPILNNNFNKFKTTLSEYEIQLFEAIARQELEFFNYALVNANDNNNAMRKWKVRYYIAEKLLCFKVQLRALFKDKNSFLRYKKNLFLLLLNLQRTYATKL